MDNAVVMMIDLKDMAAWNALLANEHHTQLGNEPGEVFRCQWVYCSSGRSIMENQLFELARKRRSIRQYGNKRIDDDVIAEIMKVALTAPTSFGHHAVEFVVVVKLK